MRNILFIIPLLLIGCLEESKPIKSVNVESESTQNFAGDYQGVATFYNNETERSHVAVVQIRVEDGDLGASGFAERIIDSGIIRDSVMVDSVNYEYSDFYYTREIQTLQAEGSKLKYSSIKDYFSSDSVLQRRITGVGELQKAN